MSSASVLSLNDPPSSGTPRPSTSHSIQTAVSQSNSSSGNITQQVSLNSSGVYPPVPANVGVPRSSGSSATTQTVNGAATPAAGNIRKRRSIFDMIKSILSWQAVHSILHGAGLKPLSYKRKYKGVNGQEVPKPVLFKSWLLALTTLDTHFLPTMITIVLINFNAKVVVNGPPISVLATYALQGASKLHELTIVASLARIITDVLRYQLLDDGVDFGMLSSPFSFLGLNYLWSQEFISAVRSGYRLRTKAHCFFILMLAAFCLLAAVVGPASALLFLPSTAWISAGSTDFFLIGTEDQLWPRHLTQSPTDDKRCEKGDPGDFWCPQGGWDYIQGFVTPEGVSRRTVNIADASTPRWMWLWRDPGGGNGTDSWASTPHGASTYLAERMLQDHEHAWAFARGKQERIRDATVAGRYSQFTGRIPVVRVVCAPIRPVNRTSPTLLYPILELNKPWRIDDTPGVSKELKLEDDYEKLINVILHSLPPGFGSSTGGLGFVTNNESTAVGCGCSFDARWAKGVSELQGELKYWQAFIGESSLPTTLQFKSSQRRAFFAPEIHQYLGPQITSDISWLQKLSTGYPLMDSTGNFTTLEVLLISTRLWDLSWALDDTVNPIRELEAVISAYLVNALSREGWDPQRHPSREEVNPILRVGNRDSDAILHTNGQIWERPTNVSTQALHQEWYTYATAWQLGNPSLYISIAILGIHLLVVLLHSAWIMWKSESSEAWNSISEIVALAYLSQPADGILKNCGSAIMLQKTLRQRVRVIAVEEHSEHQVRLVLCDYKQPRAKDAAVVIDREYG